VSCDHFTVLFAESKEAVVSCDHFTVLFAESKEAVVSCDQLRHECCVVC
jgi:hypothetical protein